VIADAVPTVLTWTSSGGQPPTRSSAKRLCHAESVLEFKEGLEGISAVIQDENPRRFDFAQGRLCLSKKPERQEQGTLGKD
jgi:hypothetical protein